MNHIVNRGVLLYVSADLDDQSVLSGQVFLEAFALVQNGLPIELGLLRPLVARAAQNLLMINMKINWARLGKQQEKKGGRKENNTAPNQADPPELEDCRDKKAHMLPTAR